MKPLQLMMTAFGPYKNKETINFEQLKDHRLFVISGATGAGKTTIFDAISFALYGSASGSDRDNITMLRSDFAEEDVHTEVELRFELKAKQYRILRRLGHLKSGNKTKTGDKIEFFELVDGVEIPAVERQIISIIDNKLQEIIGLSPDQFKQIVMLPQGEFRKLLTSETENKEAILRRLFKTEKYAKLNELLKVKRDYYNQQFASEEQMKQHFIQSIHTSLEKREDAPIFRLLENEHYNSLQVIEELEVEVTHYQEKLKVEEADYQQALKKHEKVQTAYHQSISVNEQFNSLEQKYATLKQFENNAERIKLIEVDLLASERASVIEPYEKQLIEKRIELNKKNTQLEDLKSSVSKANITALEIKSNYEKIEKKHLERDNLARELEKLTDFLPIVKEIESNRLMLLNDEKALKRQEVEITNVKKVIDSKSNEMEKIKQDIQKIEQETKNLSTKKEEVNTLRTKFTLFRNYRKLSLVQIETKDELTKKESIYEKTKQNYEDFESVWLQNQAVILAHDLHNGENCPVCGSIDHPDKARNSSNVVTREILDQVKVEVEQTHKIYLDELTNFRANEKQLSQLAKEISEYDVDIEEVAVELEGISQYGVKLNDEVVAMEEGLKKLEQLKKNAEEINEFIKQATVTREENADKYQKNLTIFTTSEATFKERISNIDGEMQDAKNLTAKINDVKQQKSVLDREWETVQKELEVTQEAKTRAEVNLLNGENQLVEINESLGMIESSFVLELRKANFETEEAYTKAKKPRADRETIKEEIEKHKQSIITLNKQIEELTTLLKDKQKTDTVALEKEVAENKQISETMFHQLNATKKNHETALSIQENIVKIDQQSAKLERKLTTVSDLHDVMRGRNDKKLSFERYVQIDYLEQIMGAANGRLRDLSNGQYYLIKSDRLESGGRQSGLSIDVYDAYTGQTRDVKTLSGGEKFNASLSLALGMSDVIQSFQGNISIDTMFIDEGFGSLDEESLTKAIDALIDLQKTGRMIGVISHVEELKSIFPATLEVTKTKEGYSNTQFILK